MRKCLLSILLISVSIFSFTQTSIIDSLKLKLINASDTLKVTMLLEAGNIYSNTGKYDSALNYYFKAVDIAEKVSDKIFLIRSLSNISDLYAIENRTQMALKFAFQALEIAKQQKYETAIYVLQSSIGLIYFNNGQFKESLPYGLNNL